MSSNLADGYSSFFTGEEADSEWKKFLCINTILLRLSEMAAFYVERRLMPILKNARHEKFVQCLIAGMSQRQAYREAFPASNRWKDKTVDNRASELFREVLGRYKELQEEAQDAAIMTRKERMVVLSNIAQNAEKESDMIKAIDTLNKMEGDYTNKVELSGEVKTNPYADLTTEELRRLANVTEDG